MWIIIWFMPRIPPGLEGILSRPMELSSRENHGACHHRRGKTSAINCLACPPLEDSIQRGLEGFPSPSGTPGTLGH